LLKPSQSVKGMRRLLAVLKFSFLSRFGGFAYFVGGARFTVTLGRAIGMAAPNPGRKR